LPFVLALSAAAADPPTRPTGVTPEQMLARLQETYPHCKLHDPQTQRQDFIVHPDFEVSLFASSPWVINPIAMAWDPAGRLWVINSPTYPQILPGQQPTDFISVLEDTNDDGRADRCTIFYDRLYVPTGLELGDGGVYVANQPDLLFLKDTDGDLRADMRRVLLSGFGTEDNHHAISAFRWGPDGWLYFMSGIFLHTQVETPHGLVRLDDGGVFMFRPRPLKLDLYNVGTATNPWGHGFDRWFQNFLTEGPQGGIWWLEPAAVSSHPSQRVPELAAPKSCGVEFIESRHFDDKYQGLMVLNAFKNKTVNLYQFSDDGAGYAAKELQPLLIVSREEFFRPVDVRTGPDGALYIADFFQPVIGHMQYEFRDPRRDHLNGRIWRVTQKGRPPLPKPRLVHRRAEEIVACLKSPNSHERNMARRVLYDSNPREVAAALATYLANLDPADPDVEHQRLEALWAYQTIDVPNLALLDQLLDSPDPRARAAAVRALRLWLPKVSDPLARLARAVADDHPRVRLEAVVALSYVKEPRAMELCAAVVDKPMDRFLNYAFRHVAAALKDQWLPAFQAGALAFGNQPHRVQAVLTAIESQGAVKPLLAMLKNGQVSSDRRPDVLRLIATLGSAEELSELASPTLYQNAEGAYDATLQGDILERVAQSAATRHVAPPIPSETLRGWIMADDHSLRVAGVRLVGALKRADLESQVADLAANLHASRALRDAAIDALASLATESAKRTLAEVAQDDPDAAVRFHAIAQSSQFDLDHAAKLAAESLAGEPAADPGPLLGAILARRGGDLALGRALVAQAPSPDAAKLALRWLNAAGHQAPAVIEPLRQAVGLSSLAARLAAEEPTSLLAEIRAKGDPHRGEQVFRRKDLTCTSCHAICGAGPHVGPDLEGIGVSSPLDYIVESILDPNARVREGFGAVAVATTEGNLYTGIQLARDDQSLILRDAASRGIVRIPSDVIDEIAPAPSIMPKGLVDSMTRQEFLDLARFISELGRPGPFATRNIPVIRSWRSLIAVPSEFTSAQNADPRTLPPVENSAAWEPLTSHVSGDLVFDVADSKPIQIVRAKIDVGTPGRLLLRINDPRGLTLWIDHQAMPVAAETLIDVAQGTRILTFRVDLGARENQPLRVVLDEVPDSPARAQVASWESGLE
jgi:putative heme-binding domain-containing protein